ncbi:hypothetical protein BN946_scf184659.g1 [Trametes cinnabarina]|uniref:HTH CENPB-type domain-containing protein n=1 Tax=Pycnoporus cinnabarinus TaxID=5643 RepID=A0A060SV68_PYCCI|nr:hypothetical protein BN946_scf184659.g1 [Trametes cinnabarina]
MTLRSRTHSGKKARNRSVLSSAEKEELYQQAVTWLKAHISPTGQPHYTEAFKRFPGLSYDTIRRRYQGTHRSHTVAHENQMLLTRVQESTLVEWMQKDALEGHPWTRMKLKARVKELTGGTTLPSNDWLAAFESRHQGQVHLRGTTGLDPLRARCFNPQNVQDHFALYEKIKDNYRVILNFDETGRQKGGGRKCTGKKYYTAAGDRTKYKTRDASLELITVIECCCNDGTMLDPGFIFAGNGTYTTEWFEGQEGRRISHNSHLTDELIDLGIKYNIDFYLLPSHTTHKLQPLDVSCFGPLQKEWLTRCEEIVEETGQPLDRGQFIKEYLDIRDRTITPEIVMGLWRKTGLVPFNADIFDEAAFAPSRPWSTLAHLPLTFPSLDLASSQPASSHTAPENSPDCSPLEEPSRGADEAEPTDAMDISGLEREHEPGLTHDDPGGRSPSPMVVDEEEDSMSPSQSVGSDASDSSRPAEPTAQIHTALLQFLPLPGPHFPVFRRSSIPSGAISTDTIKILTGDLDELEKLYQAEFQHRLAAESHCAHAAKAITNLKGRLTARATKEGNKEKRFKSKAKFLMSPEATAEHEQQRKEKAVKAREDQEKRDRQSEREREERKQYLQMVTDPNIRFLGSLKSKKKTVLRAIASLLALPGTGTNEELSLAIHSHLVNNPSHMADPHFEKLYNMLPSPSSSAPGRENSHAAIAPTLPPSLSSSHSATQMTTLAHSALSANSSVSATSHIYPDTIPIDPTLLQDHHRSMIISQTVSTPWRLDSELGFDRVSPVIMNMVSPEHLANWQRLR